MSCSFTFQGVKDFIPQPTENTYEGFEDLIDRMNYWLKEQSDMYLTNLQSVMVQKQNGNVLVLFAYMPYQKKDIHIYIYIYIYIYINIEIQIMMHDHLALPV